MDAIQRDVELELETFVQDAISLTHRPLFHCTSLVLAACAALYAWAMLQNQLWVRRAAVVMAVSAVSHHIRDGYRRGIWMWPLPSIPPYPYALYLVATVALPFLAKWAIPSDLLDDEAVVSLEKTAVLRHKREKVLAV